jgi:hypothetical protein
MRVLLAGWFSFLNGEATAGDLLALRAVRQSLDDAGLDSDIAWSPGFQPGGLRIEDAPPDRYSHLVFVCGPLHGEQFTALHSRFAAQRRIAIGVSVIDPADPACAAFDLVLARMPPRTSGSRRSPIRRSSSRRMRSCGSPRPRSAVPICTSTTCSDLSSTGATSSATSRWAWWRK